MYFYHINIPPPNPPRSTPPSYPHKFVSSFKKTKTKNASPVCAAHILGYMATHWGRVDLPETITLNKTDYYSLSSYQLPIAPQIRMELHDPPILGF